MAPGTTARTLPGINTASTRGLPHNGWLLRHGFGFLNVSYPGKKPLTIEPGKPLVLKYRVVLFSGESMDPASGGSGQHGRP